MAWLLSSSWSSVSRKDEEKCAIFNLYIGKQSWGFLLPKKKFTNNSSKKAISSGGFDDEKPETNLLFWKMTQCEILIS